MSKSRKLRESTKKIVAYNQLYKCALCKILLPPSFQCDHLIPHSISDDDTIENLQALCGNCHSNKSQREVIRISQFKRLLSTHTNFKICWFCLETFDNNEEQFNCLKCDKTVKDIEIILKKQNDIIKSYGEIYNKYKYIDKSNMNKLTNSFKEIKIETLETLETLEISISSTHIQVNNYICRVGNDYTIENIVEAIFMSTRSKKESYKYSIVSVTIIFEGTEEEKIACIDYLSENLPNAIPTRILKKNTDIEFQFSYV